MITKQNKHIGRSEKAIQNETTGYCMQMGSAYCTNECPNKCQDRFQNLIDKLFENMRDNDIGARQ
ncbi:MAG: hypothetical protein H6Q64_2117 [Firmicutes bacterium]|nr:hypothetical protein [Bacillota bacterium]